MPGICQAKYKPFFEIPIFGIPRALMLTLANCLHERMHVCWRRWSSSAALGSSTTTVIWTTPGPHWQCADHFQFVVTCEENEQEKRLRARRKGAPPSKESERRCTSYAAVMAEPLLLFHRWCRYMSFCEVGFLQCLYEHDKARLEGTITLESCLKRKKECGLVMTFLVQVCGKQCLCMAGMAVVMVSEIRGVCQILCKSHTNT